MTTSEDNKDSELKQSMSSLGPDSIHRYPSSKTSTMRSFAVTSNLYPEAHIRSNNFQSRSTLTGLLKSVAPPAESGRGGSSIRTSIARDLTGNQLFQHQRRLSAEHDSYLDLPVMPKALEEDEFGFKSHFSSQLMGSRAGVGRPVAAVTSATQAPSLPALNNNYSENNSAALKSRENLARNFPNLDSSEFGILVTRPQSISPLDNMGRSSAYSFTDKHRKNDDEEMSGGARCCFGFLAFIAQVLLHGVLGLVFFWVVQYHSKEDKPYPFSWRDDPELEFNLHPVLMIGGFIYFMGQAMLMYRSCRCCRRIWSKLLHTMFHLLAAPCIAIGFVAVLDSHNLRTDKNGNPAPIPNFYSLHSWMGLTTMGLFALQFLVGFFSFLLLLCCESATASFRAALVPIHSTFGISTFVMAVATACTGLTEKAFFTLSMVYSKWVPYLTWGNPQGQPQPPGLNSPEIEYTEEMFAESLVINVLGAALIGLIIVMPILVLHPKFRYRSQRVVTVTHDRYG